MTGTALDRAAIISGLRDLVAELRDAGDVAGIRLVGGAALALRYFDRGTTQDLDVLHVNPGSDESVAAAERVAHRRGWDAQPRYPSSVDPLAQAYSGRPPTRDDAR